MLAGSDDMTRNPLGDCHECAINHEHAVIKAFDHLLHQHASRVFFGFLDRDFNLLGGLEIQADSASVVGIEGLYNDWKSNLLSCSPCSTHRAHQDLAWHRKSEISENLVGLFFVGGNLHSDVPRVGRDGGLNALLVPTVSKLNEGVVVEANPGNVPFFCRLYERGG